jgi:hypothetical protein
MDRLLKIGSSVASSLAAVALVLGVMASSAGQVKADIPEAGPVTPGYCDYQYSDCVNNHYCFNPNRTCVYDSAISKCSCIY